MCVPLSTGYKQFGGRRDTATQRRHPLAFLLTVWWGTAFSYCRPTEVSASFHIKAYMSQSSSCRGTLSSTWPLSTLTDYGGRYRITAPRASSQRSLVGACAWLAGAWHASCTDVCATRRQELPLYVKRFWNGQRVALIPQLEIFSALYVQPYCYACSQKADAETHETRRTWVVDHHVGMYHSCTGTVCPRPGYPHEYPNNFAMCAHGYPTCNMVTGFHGQALGGGMQRDLGYHHRAGT